jgi:hypothetical protein
MAYAARLVEACREKGLNAIAVTDHHDMTFIPYVKRAALAETDANGASLASERQLIKPIDTAADTPWVDWRQKLQTFRGAYEAAVRRSSAHHERMEQLQSIEQRLSAYQAHHGRGRSRFQSSEREIRLLSL